jgi:hypothetical protein
MFVAISVQFKSLGAQGKLRSYGTSRLSAAVSILEQLKEFWTPLRLMWSTLANLFKTANLSLPRPTTSSRKQNPSPPDGTNIEQIVSHHAVPNPSGATNDLYTYLADAEPKGSTPSRASS